MEIPIKITNWSILKVEIKIDDTEDLDKAEKELERQINVAVARSSETKLVNQLDNIYIIQKLLKKKTEAKKR